MYSKHNILLILLLGMTSLLLYFSVNNSHNWGDDFAGYISQAESLLKGTPTEFLADNQFTIEKSSYAIGPVAYPWGFPAMLAPFYAYFGLNPIALKSVGVLSFLLLLSVMWFGFREYHNDLWLVFLICLFSLNPQMVGYTNNILSDLPFMLVSTATIFLIGRNVVKGNQFIGELSDKILIGIFISVAYFIRENGILLLFTLAMTQFIILLKKSKNKNLQCPFDHNISYPLFGDYSLFKRKGNLASTAVIQTVPLLTALIFIVVWEIVLPSKGSAHAFSSVSFATIKDNIMYYFLLPSEFFSSLPGDKILYWISIPFACLGVFKRYKSEFYVLIYISLTIMLYIIWPVPQGLRYIFPILPFYFSFVVSGVESFQNQFLHNKNISKFLSFGQLSLIILLFIIYLSHEINANKTVCYDSAGPFTSDSNEMFNYIKSSTESDSVVVFFKPRLMRLMTGRRSIMINNVEQLKRGDYLCIHVAPGSYDQVKFQEIEKIGISGPIFENHQFKIYQLKKIDV